MAIVGAHGSGKTTFVHRFALSMRRHSRSLMDVKLPALVDVEAWTKFALAQGESTVFVFDDMPAQLEKYSSEDQHFLWHFIDDIQWRGYTAVFVLSTEDTTEFIYERPNGDKVLNSTFLVELIRLNSKQYHHTPSRYADYDYLTSTFWSVIEWRWQMYIELGIIFKTTNFGSRTLVNLMEKIPILDTLHPIDYTNLEGRFLSEPSKSFAVLGSIVAEAQSRTEHGGVACLTDDDVTRVIGDVTGLAASLVRPMTFETRRQQALEVAEGLSFDQTTLVEAVEDIYLPMIQMDRPMAVFCVQDRTKRRAPAGRLAKSLFGSGSAILILDYEKILD